MYHFSDDFYHHTVTECIITDEMRFIAKTIQDAFHSMNFDLALRATRLARRDLVLLEHQSLKKEIYKHMLGL